MKSTLCIQSGYCFLTLLLATQVAAETPIDAEQYKYRTQAVIGDSALQQGRGIIGVNVVAGDSNAQLNARALAVSVGQGVQASARIKASQHVGLPGGGQIQPSV